MIIKNIEISNFRNYGKLKLAFSPNINVIYGKNAQGKTNLLESIYFLSTVKSHRLSSNKDLIKIGSKTLNVKGSIYDNDIETKYQISLSDTKKKIKIDGNEKKKISDYISNIYTIIFYPEDLELIKGSPGQRREYINDEISSLYNSYYNILCDYNKLLKMKNDYLKSLNQNCIDYNYLEILNSYYIEKGIMISKMRKKFIDKINEYGEKIFLEITGKEKFNIKYNSFIEFSSYDLEDMKQKFKEEQRNLFEEEIKLRTSLVGPHRDDISFNIGDSDLKKYGSQGQQRVAILTMKLSLIEIIKKYKKSTPILLLDDIFSELDDVKKNNLLNYINQDMQVIITTTDLNNINLELLKNSKLIEIQTGKIKNIKEVDKNARK